MGVLVTAAGVAMLLAGLYMLAGLPWLLVIGGTLLLLGSILRYQVLPLVHEAMLDDYD